MNKPANNKQEKCENISGVPPAAWVWFVWIAIVFAFYFKGFAP